MNAEAKVYAIVAAVLLAGFLLAVRLAWRYDREADRLNYKLIRARRESDVHRREAAQLRAQLYQAWATAPVPTLDEHYASTPTYVEPPRVQRHAAPARGWAANTPRPDSTVIMPSVDPDATGYIPHTDDGSVTP